MFVHSVVSELYIYIAAVLGCQIEYVAEIMAQQYCNIKYLQVIKFRYFAEWGLNF